MSSGFGFERPRVRLLPPRPDPATGRPFPPAGRGWHQKDDSRQASSSDGGADAERKPEPPPGRSPVLAWHSETKRGKLAVFLGAVGVLTAGMTIIRALDGGGPFDWAGLWQIWLLILIVSLLITGPMTYTRLSAGADWLRMENIRFGRVRKSGVLDLYRLRKVEVLTGGSSLYLDLADDAHIVHLAMVEWQGDRRLWDLIFNGIVHSAANGAEVDQNARAVLDLADEVDMSQHAAGRKIYVRELNDSQVQQVMADPAVQDYLRSLAQRPEGLDEFRRAFPVVFEHSLAGRPDPSWFDTSRAADPDKALDAKWQRFYSGE